MELALRHSLTDCHIEQLVELFRNEWWSRGRDTASVQEMLSSTDLVFALVEPSADRLGAFARVLTDRVYFAIVLDVIVAPSLRGQQLGRRLIDAICAHPHLARVQSLELVCQPALTPFYRKLGFTDQVGASTLMRRTAAQHLTGFPGGAA